MRMYTGKIKKYKKFLYSRRNFSNLVYATSLKPGDIVTSCSGYNRIVYKTSPVYVHVRKQIYLIDVDILFKDGTACEAMRCCTFPTMSRLDVLEVHNTWYSHSNEKLYNKFNRNLQWHTTEIYKIFHNPSLIDERGCYIEHKKT